MNLFTFRHKGTPYFALESLKQLRPAAVNGKLQVFRVFLFTLFLSVGMGASAQLLQWNTAGNTGNETTEPSISNDAHISGPVNLTKNGITAAGNQDRFGGTGWSNSFDATKYIQFIVTPNAGYQFTATSFSAPLNSSGTGPKDWVLRSSVDNYQNNICTVQSLSNNNVTILTFNFLSAISSTTPVTFRLYGYSASAGTGTGGIDNTGMLTTNAILSGTTLAVKQNQTITWGQTISPKTFGDADFNLTATASSNLTVTYASSNPAVATVSGNTVHIVAAGSTNITASQAGNGSYNPAPDVTKALQVDKLNQTINFGALPAKEVGDADFNLSATASSGLTVSYSSSNPAVATVSGNTVHIVAAGSTTITASQAGDNNYNPATTVDQELVVTNPNLQDQTITFNALSPVTYGDANFNLTATASSNLTVTYISSNTDVATVSGNTVTIVGAGTTTITASQAGNGTYNPADPVNQVLQVNTKGLTVTGATVGTKTYDGNTNATISGGTLVGVINADDVSIGGNAGTFASPNAGTGIAVTANLTLSGTDMGNYFLTQPSGLTGDINKANQTITFNGPLPDKMVGESDFTLTATSTSGLPVSFTSTAPSVATVTNGGLVHIVAVGSTFFVAAQAGDGNYNPATNVQQQQTITPLTPVSIWSNPITGTNPGLTNPYTTGQTVASGITVPGISYSGVTGENANNRYNAKDWSTGGYDNSKYFEWTLTPDNGKAINFSSLAYTSQASNNGPNNFAIRSSLDNFGADLANPGATGTTLSLAGAQFQGVASAISFRVYGWSATNSTGTFSINDFTFSGNIVTAPPVVSVTVTNRSACGPDNGSITTNVTGGTAPYSYSWTGLSGSGAGVPFAAGNVSSISNLNYGFYNVTVTDANAVSVTVSNIHVGKAFLPVITHNGQASSACGNTATLIIYASAGVAPYTYSVDGINYQASNSFSGLAAGPMTMYAKDASGCIGTKNFTIQQAAPIVVNPYVYPASSCSNDGKIDVYRSGGIPPYTYSLDNINYQASNSFTGLAGGSNQTVYVKDSKGCVGSANVTVGQGAALSLTAQKANTSSCINNGAISITVSGGTPAYTYSMDNVNYQPSRVFTDLPAGIYTVYAKDSKGCTGSINVTIGTVIINVAASATPASGCLINDGSIIIFPSGGGQGPFTYSVDGNNYQASNSFTGLAPGYYSVFIKDANTCTGELDDVFVGPDNCGSRVAAGSRKPINAVNVTVKAFPNPSNDAFMITMKGFDLNRKVSVLVTDVLGRRVAQYETSATQLVMGSKLQAGTYQVQLIQGENRKSLTIVKE